MAAARLREAACGLPSEIGEIFGEGSELIFAIPEHKAPLPGGRRESQSLVFALVRTPSSTIALAVEAKVAEPFGTTIEAWITDGSQGKRLRLAAIRKLLGCPTLPGYLRYQLFHHTAAAIVEAERMHFGSTAMIAASFSQDHLWFDDFAAFCAFLGVEPRRSAPISVQLHGERDLILGWATGNVRFLEHVAEMSTLGFWPLLQLKVSIDPRFGGIVESERDSKATEDAGEARGVT